MSTVLRVYVGFDGSSVAPRELGSLTVQERSKSSHVPGTLREHPPKSPFGGLSVPKEDVAGLLRMIADELDPEETS